MRVGVRSGTLAALLAVGSSLVIVSPVPTRAAPPDTGTVIVDETFQGGSVADPGWTVQGDTCLTGASAPPPAGAAVIPQCPTPSGDEPTPGVLPGYLQLTRELGFIRGSILYNRPIPAVAGVSVVFEQYQYGGSGADGIGFFLVDGSTDLTSPGADGGSLGYAQRGDTPGVVGGYIGVGLDAYGNYYNDSEGRGNGCPEGSRSPTTASGQTAPNVITLRSRGTGTTTGYCYVESTTPKPITNPDRPGTSLNGGTGTLRAATLPESRRLVHVMVTPAPDIEVVVEVSYDGGTTWVEEMRVPAPPDPPGTYKLGFSASTGGSTDVHLIRNVVVRSVEPLAELQLVKDIDQSVTPPLPAEIVDGTVIPYVYTVTNAGLETITGLTVTDDRVDGIVTCAQTTLPPAPDPNATTTCRGTYTVTAADIAAGVPIVNVAVAGGLDTGGAPVVSNTDTETVPLLAAISLSKGVLTPSPYAVGQQVDYSYVVTNTGTAAVGQIVLRDDRIANQNDIVCPQSSLLPDESMPCIGTATVRSEDIGPDGLLTNTAQATGATSIGQTVVSNPADATIPVYTDVGVTKTVDNPTPVVGTNVTFTVTATNNGPSLAQNVVITDQLPAPRLELVSGTPSVGTWDPVAGTWAIPSLAEDESATLTLVATVNTNSPESNVATRTGMTQTDTDPTNDSASATVNPVEPTLDIAVSKSVLGDAVVPLGAQARFQVVATNNGPFPGTGVAIRDVLPPSLTYDAAASGGDGTYNAATGIWTIGDIPVGQSRQFTFVVTTTQLGPFTNLASLDSVSPADNNESNNSDSAGIVVRAPIADLVVIKGVIPEEAVVGQTVTYSVTASNAGRETVHGAFVTDVGPGGMELVPGSSRIEPVGQGGTFDEAALRWDIGTMVPGAIFTLRVDAIVRAEGTQINTVTIDAPALTDPTPQNNHSTATVVTAQPPLDLAVTKAVAVPAGAIYPVDAVPVGETVVFTMTVSNAVSTPPVDATNVVLTDVLGDGLEYVSHATTLGSFVPATGLWTILTLADGASATFTMTATATTEGQHQNVIALTSLTQQDTDDSNNSDEATITAVELADLAITKTNVPTVAQPGDEVVYTIEVTNNGPFDAVDVVAFDPLRTEADIVEVVAEPGTTFDLATRVWTIPSLTVGATATLTVTIEVLPQASGHYRNFVAVLEAQQVDPDLSNNVDDAELFVPVADIAVLKDVAPPQMFAGGTATFTIGVANLGPDPAEAVTVDDLLPSGLELVSAVPSLGTYDAATGVWSVGDLDPVPLDPAPTIDQATLSLTVRAPNPGTFVNTASSDRVGAFPYDPDTANNTDSATLVATLEPADLAVAKSAEPISLSVGATSVFTVVTTNLGPGVARDAVLDDTFPEGLRPITVSDARCTISGQSVRCAFGTMASGASIGVNIAAVATTAGTWTNTATVSGASPDPVTENNTATAGVTATAVAAPIPGTVIVTKRTTGLASGVFGFTFGATSFTLVAGASHTITGVAPGTYTLVESALGPWRLQTLECTDPTGDSVVTVAERQASIVVASGETVSCTFTNAFSGGQLPATGNHGIAPILAAALTLIGLGGLLVAIDQRRRRAITR